MRIRRTVRRLTGNRFLGALKRALQKCLYYLRGLIGSFLLSILRFLRLIEPIPEWRRDSIKKILILKPERIGDTILATPAFQAAREHFPDAYIALVVSWSVREIMEGNPDINKLFTFKTRGVLTIFKEWDTIKQLKDMRFDLAVVLYPTFWCNLVAFLSEARHRVGYDFHHNGFFLTVKVPYRCERIVKHEVEVNLDVVRAISVDTDKKELFIGISKEAEEYISGFLTERGLRDNSFVVIHPGAREDYIRWDENGFAKVADMLIKEQSKEVVLLAGPDEGGLIKKIAGLMKFKPIIAADLKLSQTVSLIKKARLFIGNSTGPMHIAAALKIPVVTIFGNVHPLDSYEKWGPYGEGNIVIHKDVGCIDCEPSDCRRFMCIEAVTPEDVLEAVRKQLNIISKR